MSRHKSDSALGLASDTQGKPDQQFSLALFPGEDEMAQRIREYDWGATPLGPVEGWSPSLKMIVRFLLANRFPILLWWGPEFIQIYNTPYRPILGTKHPQQSLGKPVSQCWAEIWHVLRPLIITPYEGGPATWMDDITLEISRYGFTEETHFTIAYSPVPDDTVPSGIGGVLATVNEITDKVIAERRVIALRDLGSRVAEAKSAEQACSIAAEILEKHPKDVPFAMLYLLDPAGKVARLAANAGVATEFASNFSVISLDESSSRDWPLAEVARHEQEVVIEDLRKLGEVAPGPWSDPPRQAVALPIKSNVPHRPAGILVAGVSARLKLDDQYRTFFDLVASQIATAVANARAYEEERRRAEALAELDRAKTTFFSNVSHEFRTPLTLMLGPTESALRSPQKKLEGSDLEMVHRNEVRLLKLVNMLLDFSRIEAGRVQASYQPTELAEVTAGLASEFQSVMEHAGLRLIIDCPPLPEPVYVDREMWEKIVLNLVSNAFKSTFDGSIKIAVQAKGERALLVVQDTGTGIPSEQLGNIFDRFHRIEGARRRTHEGSGIGLALVDELVKLHGGSIAVTSKPGEGSTFTVSIPFGQAHLPQDRIGAKPELSSTSIGTQSYVHEALSWIAGNTPAEPEVLSSGMVSPPPAAGIGGRVLVVDDNRDMREYIAHMLGAHFEVSVARNGKEALETVLREKPDLVLTDIMMPEMDGLELLAAIRSHPEIAATGVMLLSARAGDEARVQGLQHGADDYLIKPFSAGELLARVGAHLKLARLRQESEHHIQRLTDEATRERHRTFRDLVERAPFGMYIVDAEFRIAYMNAGSQTGAFRNVRPVIGRDFSEAMRILWPAEIAKEIIGIFRHTLDTGQPYYSRDFVNPRKDIKNTESYEWELHRISLPDGKRGVICYYFDSTRLRDAEAEVRKSEERFRALVTASTDVIYRMSPDWGEMSSLDGKGFLADTPELNRNWIYKYILPDDQERVKAAVDKAIRTKSNFQLEHRVRRADGSVGWTHSQAIPLRDDRGEIVEWFGAASDVTARKRAEVATGRLASIVESSEDAIISKDLSDIITSWNRSAEDLFGYTAEEAIGQSILLLIPADRSDEESFIRSQVGGGGSVDHFETVRKRKDGSLVELSLTISPIRDDAGIVVGSSQIARDITERRRAERELKESEERLRKTEKLAAAGQLAASLAHEINNPLSSVTNALYLLKNQGGLRDHARSLVEIASGELARMSRIVRQSLSYYRVGSEPKDVDIAAAISDSLQVFSSKIERSGITVTPRIVRGHAISGFPDEIRQVIDNLLLNAIEAMPEGGRLWILVHPSREWKHKERTGVRMTIVDTGTGIPGHIASRIFEPFFTTKPEKGTGLGLWVVRGLVAKHEGTIRVRSSSKPGRSGTAISVFWPVGRQPQPPEIRGRSKRESSREN